jgi:soluble lytic murein transglycosylase
MQLMPATARQTAQRMGLPFNRDRLTDDPDYNVRLGQAYLDELLDRFGGSYILALAAYNAGPRRATSWIDLHGDPRDPSVDPIDWIERVPFSETRNYIQRILESLVVYRDGDPKEANRWALHLPPAGS